ncbi:MULTISPECIES: hypothetical protein [Chryseobacterium]|uniref:Uncharacterized protein n=1 Tax=Chryseobacterium endophyticum TaxID=1854762 RepID=A0AAU6WRU9_9FLAO|nr:hypothetical protein [uncultured Chryseobacterium sp.]
MKSIYITLFLACGLHAYAQENRKTSDAQTQEAVNYKESKALEDRMMKEAQQRIAEKPLASKLASEEGLPVKLKSQTTTGTSQDRQHKLLSTRDVTIQDIRKTIPKD